MKKRLGTATALLSLAALVCGQATAGCVEKACTDVGCNDSVGVVLEGAATKFAANLPVTVTVCVGSTCSAFRIDHTGAAPLCTAMSAGNALCTIDGEGNVVLTALPLLSGDEGAQVAVHATVTDGTGTALFDDTQTVAVTTTQPNGPDCAPVCQTAQAAFTP